MAVSPSADQFHWAVYYALVYYGASTKIQQITEFNLR